MAADLGGTQISALLESVPGIRNVLRSPVADALVNMIQTGAGLRPFDYAEADELIQYAVRRGLISAGEGDSVLAEVRETAQGRRSLAGTAKGEGAGSKPAAKKPRPVAKKARPAAKKAPPPARKPRPAVKKPVKKAAAKRKR